MSRKPPTSPARHMLTISGGKTSGCLAMLTDSELPVSMSLRTSPRIRASSLFSVWSVRMLSDRSRLGQS
jgi:hypothetical protein